jgi:hypothetical protein
MQEKCFQLAMVHKLFQRSISDSLFAISDGWVGDHNNCTGYGVGLLEKIALLPAKDWQRSLCRHTTWSKKVKDALNIHFFRNVTHMSVDGLSSAYEEPPSSRPHLPDLQATRRGNLFAGRRAIFFKKKLTYPVLGK